MEKIKITKEHSRLLWGAGIKVALAVDVLSFVLEDLSEDLEDLDNDCLNERVIKIKKELNRISSQLCSLSKCQRKGVLK